jgi:hypothetical protein
MCSRKVARLGHSRFIDISKREMAPTACERDRDSSADTASGSGDHCGSSFKSHLFSHSSFGLRAEHRDRPIQNRPVGHVSI